MDQSNKLSRLTIRLHWLVAIVVVGLVCVGVLMKYGQLWSLYPIHKSFGVLALLVILPRVVWRIKNGWPKPVHSGRLIEQRLAKVVHWLLILATLVMPISGMLLSGAGGFGFGVFGLTIVPANHALDNPEEAVAYNDALSQFGYGMHSWAGYLLILAIVLHVIGAFKHHWVDRDLTLKRMLGRH